MHMLEGSGMQFSGNLVILVSYNRNMCISIMDPCRHVCSNYTMACAYPIVLSLLCGMQAHGLYQYINSCKLAGV